MVVPIDEKFTTVFSLNPNSFVIDELRSLFCPFGHLLRKDVAIYDVQLVCII